MMMMPTMTMMAVTVMMNCNFVKVLVDLVFETKSKRVCNKGFVTFRIMTSPIGHLSRLPFSSVLMGTR